MFVSALLGTLVTPYFGAEWIVFFSKTSHPLLHSEIIEFGPATILDAPVGMLLHTCSVAHAFPLFSA